MEGDELATAVVDEIAGMTDRFAVRRFREVYEPKAWSVLVSRIAGRSLEAVKERADIVELARARTELRQVRDEWIGRCPFHEERSPSFSVNAGKKLYYCFGCGAKGDVIDFVRQTEAVDYVGAIEWLAGRYGLELEYEEASPVEEARRRRDDRLRTLLDETASWYARRLATGEAGAAARAYLAGRGLSDEMIERFGVGLAPEGWDGLSRAAQGRGYTVDELVTAGLALRAARTGNVIDHFRGRLMFPIADARGRVVAFGGRVLPGSDDKRKYVNSPEGPLFHKGEVLYGLHLARTEIAKRDLTLVVEGYTDALALAQAGHPNVVASQGTALTERQLRLLRGLSRNVVLLFDSDAAGEGAALRGVQIAEREGLHGAGRRAAEGPRPRRCRDPAARRPRRRGRGCAERARVPRAEPARRGGSLERRRPRCSLRAGARDPGRGTRLDRALRARAARLGPAAPALRAHRRARPAARAATAHPAMGFPRRVASGSIPPRSTSSACSPSRSSPAMRSPCSRSLGSEVLRARRARRRRARADRPERPCRPGCGGRGRARGSRAGARGARCP